MPKLGDVVVLQMAHANDNQPCAAIVATAKDDGSVSVWCFPGNGEGVTFYRDVPASNTVDETFLAYVTEGAPAAPAEGGPAPENVAPIP